MHFFERQFVRLDNMLSRSVTLFISTIAIESFVICALTYSAVEYVFSIKGADPFSGWSPTLFFVVTVLIAPILETLVFQSLVFWTLKKTHVQGGFFWVLMITPFALVHSQFSISRAVGAGVVGGLYLGVSYVLARRRYPFFYAFAITASAHSLRNLFVVVMSHTFPD